MPTGTSQANGLLWGARARDWAEVQEGQFSAAYHDVLARMDVGQGTHHLDAGCGAGMQEQFPQAVHAFNDVFTAVADGLAIAAQDKRSMQPR
jgi:hypothetical protein